MGLFIFYVFHSLWTYIQFYSTKTCPIVSTSLLPEASCAWFAVDIIFCGHYPVKIYIFRQSLNVTSDGCTLGLGGRVSGSLLCPQSDFVCFLKMKINVKDHFSVDPALQRHEDGDAQRLLHRDVTFKSCFRFLWTCSHNFLVTLCTTCFPQGSVLRFHWWGFMSSF